jgi:hypothetical protein
MVTELKIKMNVITLTNNKGKCKPCMNGKWLKMDAGSGHFVVIGVTTLEKRCVPYCTNKEEKVNASDKRKIHIINLP